MNLTLIIYIRTTLRILLTGQLLFPGLAQSRAIKNFDQLSESVISPRAQSRRIESKFVIYIQIWLCVCVYAYPYQNIAHAQSDNPRCVKLFTKPDYGQTKKTIDRIRNSNLAVSFLI